MAFPLHLYYGFIVLSIVYAFVLFWIFNRNLKFLGFIIAWLVITAVVASTGFLAVTSSMPPRIFIFVFLFFTAGLYFIYGEKTAVFRQKISLEKLHYYHTVRIFVEFVFLFQLARLGFVSDVMSFEGRNYDVLVGVSAPIIIWLYFYKGWINTSILKAWNIAGFCILAFTVSQATLSAPSPFQQFSFDQPTVAILYFPFVWLPTFLAPAALLSHLLALKLMRERGQ